MDLLDDLRDYLKNVMKEGPVEGAPDALELRDGNYRVSRSGLPGHDFNREIVAPGKNENFPEGVLGIRVDDDFWAVAVLPLRFAELSIENLVEVIWPDIYPEAEFRPDSRDPDLEQET